MISSSELCCDIMPHSVLWYVFFVFISLYVAHINLPPVIQQHTMLYVYLNGVFIHAYNIIKACCSLIRCFVSNKLIYTEIVFPSCKNGGTKGGVVHGNSHGGQVSDVLDYDIM
jgi:hypothetical protein